MTQHPSSVDGDNLLANAQLEARAVLDRLTEKQEQVMRLAAQHFTIDQIAYETGKSRRTVEEHLFAARKKLNATNRIDALRRYVLLLDMCGEPTCGFIRVDLSTEDIEKVLQDLSFERAHQLLSAPEFEQFMQEFRSTGPKAWNAKYGRWWLPLAGLTVAGIVISLLVGSIALAESLDILFRN